MFENQLRKNEPSIRCTSSSDFNSLLQELSDLDVWVDAITGNVRLGYIEKGSTPAYIYEGATNEQVNDACAIGSLTLTVNGHNYLLNEGALFTLKDRAGMTCKHISALLGAKKYANFCDMMNLALPEYMGKKCKILIRAGQVLAVHSGNYVRLDQQLVYTALENCMSLLFPEAEFDCSSYTHCLTETTYCMSDYTATLMEEYVQAWTKAGLNAAALSGTNPIIQVNTSDTGEFCLEVAPLLKMDTGYYPLGDKYAIKHHGNARISKLEGAVKKCFIKLQDGLKDAAQLLQTELEYPVAAMIRAAEEVGIVKDAKKACRNLVEAYKACLFPGEAVSAFDIYMQLCDIRYTAEFAKMSAKTKIKVTENLYRLLALDWTSLDRPGKDEVE
ncbi:hypothetical protein AALA24_09745 [Anaerovoracaceae bacterium 42-11]